MCNKDCWNCELEGCPYPLYDSIELDRDAQIEYEQRDNRALNHNRKCKEWRNNNKEHCKEYFRNYNLTQKRKENLARYRSTDKYKESCRLYRESDRGRESQERYRKSDKRKECVKRYHESEKYKTSQKKYRQTDKFKELSRERSRKYYLEHREEILEKRRKVANE